MKVTHLTRRESRREPTKRVERALKTFTRKVVLRQAYIETWAEKKARILLHL